MPEAVVTLLVLVGCDVGPVLIGLCVALFRVLFGAGRLTIGDTEDVVMTVDCCCCCFGWSSLVLS